MVSPTQNSKSRSGKLRTDQTFDDIDFDSVVYAITFLLNTTLAFYSFSENSKMLYVTNHLSSYVAASSVAFTVVLVAILCMERLF